MSQVGRPRVLLIEGSPELRARVREILEADGLELEEATDASEGAERAAAHAPDLVLLDDDVRDFDRGGAVRRLRGALHSVHVPLVVHGTPLERDDCLTAGCDGFFDEPLESLQLPSVLRAYLAGRRDALERDRIQLEMARLAGERDRLKEQLRLTNEFLQNLAHELATPLTPLAGYLKMLRSGRLGPLSEKQQHVAEAMAHATDRLGRSIDNLVDYSSLEAGDYRIHSAELDLSPLLDALIADFHARAREKRLRIDVQRPEHLLVSADERGLRHALSHVLDNALRVSPHGGQLLMRATEQPERIEIVVYDQGPGLPPELRRLNERTPIRTLADPAGGARLGLPITRQIAEAHGGGLVLESPPAEQPDARSVFPGSKVGFWIPTGRPAAAG